MFNDWSTILLELLIDCWTIFEPLLNDC